jgi:predicted outer membrane protein
MKALLAAAGAVLALLVLGGGAAAVSKPAVDTWWLQGSIQGDRFEITAGTWAEQHARTPEAKALAAQLVGDHQHSLGNAITLAHQLHVAVPSAPSPMQQWLILTLKGMKKGTPYDQAYTSLEVQDHTMDITDTKLEIAAGHSPAAVSMAKKELAMLKVHLMLSQKAWRATV